MGLFVLIEPKKKELAEELRSNPIEPTPSEWGKMCRFLSVALSQKLYVGEHVSSFGSWPTIFFDLHISICV